MIVHNFMIYMFFLLYCLHFRSFFFLNMYYLQIGVEISAPNLIFFSSTWELSFSRSLLRFDKEFHHINLHTSLILILKASVFMATLVNNKYVCFDGSFFQICPKFCVIDIQYIWQPPNSIFYTNMQPTRPVFLFGHIFYDFASFYWLLLPKFFTTIIFNYFLLLSFFFLFFFFREGVKGARARVFWTKTIQNRLAKHSNWYVLGYEEINRRNQPDGKFLKLLEKWQMYLHLLLLSNSKMNLKQLK